MQKEKSMSYNEALEDGITVERAAGRSTVYFPPCCICGKTARSMNYIRNYRYMCREYRNKRDIKKLIRKNPEI